MKFIRKAIAVSLSLSSTLGVGPVLAATPAATPQWRVGYDDKLCMLWRSYGQGGAAVTLAIKPSLTGDATRLIVIYPGGTLAGRQSESRLLYDGKEILLQFIDLPATEKGRRVAVTNVPSAQLASALGASRWAFRSQWMHAFDFQVDGLPNAIATLDSCVDGLVKRWKLDPDSQSRLAQKAQGNLAQLISNDDYPRLAAFHGRSGITSMRLLVGSDGRMWDCAISESSGDALLDHTACTKLKERATLTPARDKSGQPAVSILTSQIRWVLGSRPRRRPINPR